MTSGGETRSRAAALRALLAAACAPAWVLAALAASAPAARAATLAIENQHIRARFEWGGGALRLRELARADGSDALDVTSDEFEVLLLDGTRFTVTDYQAQAPPSHRASGGQQVVQVAYAPKPHAGKKAPPSVVVTYTLGTKPWLHKTVFLGLRRGDIVDRLQVMRFSCGQRATRGGEGQPVFVGNWFFGLDYPGFHSRHSHGFREPDFRYKWHYTIDYEGRDREFAPRDGLVTLFHFPGSARRQPDGRWGVQGKAAVMGLSRKKGENAELALLDYIEATRLPTRSFLHFNNWYSSRAKKLDVPVFVNDVVRTIQSRLAQYGARLDAAVADHGWENTRTYSRIFEPREGLDLAALHRALAEIGVGLGLWIAFDGTNAGYSRGLQVGYKAAYAPGFDRSQQPWMRGKTYFDLLDPRYQEDLRTSLRHMIVDGKIAYIKHDFNHNFTTSGLSQRHAREACLDTTLHLLAFERRLNPRLFQNYTNGSWFSPWWFQHVHTIWMMSGDSAANDAWPQLSPRDAATSYRDAWLYQSFNNPRRCVRPLIRIADLMTHGIVFTKKKPFASPSDTLDDWSNYVVMYYARGTTLKELYIDPELLDDDQWKVLGTASAWAQANQHRLRNTLLVGSDCAAGQAYGYVSWCGDAAILAARNPDRRAQMLRVPFDASVYYRGQPGRPYHARAIYPFVHQMPWAFTSGRTMEIPVPGDSVLVLEIEPGTPLATREVAAPPLPAARAEIGPRGRSFVARLPVPDEPMRRCDLLVEVWGPATPQITLDGQPVEPRGRDGRRWTLAACDLREHRGRTLAVEGRLVPRPGASIAQDAKLRVELWLVADRKVAAPPAPSGEKLPFPISQHHRRVARQLLSAPIGVSAAAPP